MSREKSHSKLAGVRRRRKESRKKKSFNKVLNGVLNIEKKVEETKKELEGPYFPKNKSNSLLVDLLVQVSDDVKEVKKNVHNKTFVYNNIENIHNVNLKRIFKDSPKLENILIKKRHSKNVRHKVKKRSTAKSQQGSKGKG